MFSVLLLFFSTSHGIDTPHPALPRLPSPPAEDQHTINETILKYGPPENYALLGLPGPELLADQNRFYIFNKIAGQPGTYFLKTRTITDYFSYNGRYENATLKRIGLSEIPIIRGQFGEHFERKSGGFYIRTIGYVLDENGYRQFLMDLSTAQTRITPPETTSQPPLVVIPTTGATIGGQPESTTFVFRPQEEPVGSPGAGKGGISTTTLGTLIGGNSLG